MNKKLLERGSLIFLMLSVLVCSCSKKDIVPSGPIVPADPCTGKIITISAVVVAATPCGNEGRITISATGSSGFSYKLNASGTYQAGNIFDQLTAGGYTVYVKDSAGCEKSSAVTIITAGTAGPLFTAVRTLMSAKCQSCHNNTVQNGGMNWEVDCNIVNFKANIKNRAIDLGTMPPTGPLSTAEKATITDWISAGGKYTN